MRNSLVTALVACADQPQQSHARRFLAGLSSDELQFIAGFLGACVLESPVSCARNRAELAERIARFLPQKDGAWMRSTDQEHKMILLLEYLCCSGVQQPRVSAGAGGPA